MPTRESRLRARKLRRRLLLAGLTTLSGCFGCLEVAVADDAVDVAASPTFRELFQSDAAIRTSDEATPLMGELGATGTSDARLVTFLFDDPTSTDKAADKTTAEQKAADDKKDSAASDSKKESDAELNNRPEGDRLGGVSIFGGDAERSPSVRDGRFELPPLMAATTQTREIGNGRTPEGFRGDEAPILTALPESGIERTVDWDWSVRTWAAPNTFSHPRYFEDRMLERHGHECCPCLQPLASGARFFATIPMLPYLAAVSCPCDCEYTLGYYRSGSCAPALKQRPPYERKAVIVEAAAVAGVALAIP